MARRALEMGLIDLGQHDELIDRLKMALALYRMAARLCALAIREPVAGRHR
jgi:hypothetical protein